MPGTWTCTEDEDHGSLGDNLVRVTGGTSGSPADFASFVTADRAGEAVLLAATAGLSPTLAFTYAIRPVEDLALLISFIVASKTAEADFIFITGTDFAGNAQTESLDVTAGNGTYVTTKYFATISNIDCSDNAAGGGTQWADGTVRATQPQWGFIWDYGSSQYQIDCEFIIGDDSTSTYFGSKNEMVYFDIGQSFAITDNATLRLGGLIDDWATDGSMWSTSPNLAAQHTIIANGDSNASFLLYDSTLHNRAAQLENFYGGVIVAKNAVFSSEYYKDNNFLRWIVFRQTVDDLSFDRVYFHNMIVLDIMSAPSLFAYVHAHAVKEGVKIENNDVTLENLLVTSTGGSIDMYMPTANTMTALNPQFVISHPYITNAGGVIKESYTANIKVVDKNGNALQSAIVLCEDQLDAQVFSVSTNASGDIAEQIITYRQWAGTSETLTTYSPHKFTISLPGYETLILENVTVGALIAWHLELQPLRARVYGRSHRIQAAQFI